MKILVLIESINNKIHPVSIEALVAAQSIGSENSVEIYPLCLNNQLDNNYLKIKLLSSMLKIKLFYILFLILKILKYKK